MDVTKSCLLYGRRTGTQILKGKMIRKNKGGGDCFQDYWTDSDSSTDESSNSDSHSHKADFSGGMSEKESEKSSHHDEPHVNDIEKGQSDKQKENILPSMLDNVASNKSCTTNMTRKNKKHKDNIENQSPLKKLKLMQKQVISVEECFTLSKQNKFSSTKSLEISEAMNSSDTTDSEIDTPVNTSSATYKTINISRKVLMAPKLISTDLKLFDKNNVDKKDKSKCKISKTVSPLSKIINKTSILSPRRSARNNKRQTKTKNEMETEKILSNYDEYDALIMQMINENETGEKNPNSLKVNTDPLLEKNTESLNRDNKSNNTLRKKYAAEHKSTDESNQIEVLVEDNHIESSDKTLFENKRSFPGVDNSENIDEISKNMSSHVSLDKCVYSALKNQTKSFSSLEESKQFEDNSEDDVENVQKSKTVNNQVISLSETFKPTRKNTSSPVSSIETFEQNDEENSLEGDIMENITGSKRENSRNLNPSQNSKENSKNKVTSYNCLNKENSNMSMNQTNSSSFLKAPKIIKLNEKVGSNDDIEDESKYELVNTRKMVSKGKNKDKSVHRKIKICTKSKSDNEDLGNHKSHQSEHFTSRAKSPEQDFSPYKSKTRLSHKKDNIESKKKMIPCKLKGKNSTGPMERRKSNRLLSQFESGKTQDLGIDKNNAAEVQLQSPGSPIGNSDAYKNQTNTSNKALEQNCEVANVEDFIKSKTANEQSLNNSKNITESSRIQVSSCVSPTNHASSVLVKRRQTNSFSKSPDKSETDEEMIAEKGFENKSKSKRENKQPRVVKDKGIVGDMKKSKHHNKKQSGTVNLDNNTSHQTGDLAHERDVTLDQHSTPVSSELDDIRHKNKQISSKDKKKVTAANDKGIIEDVRKPKLPNKKQNKVEKPNENSDNHASHQSGHLTPEQDTSLDQHNNTVSSEKDDVERKKKHISSKGRKLTDINDVRRSTRQRYLPFDHWRNERLLYRFESGQIKVLGIDKGTREDNAAFLALEKQKHNYKNVKLRNKIIKGKLYDTVHNKKVHLDLLKTFPSVSWDEPASSLDHVPYRFKRVFDTYNSGFGFIEIDGMQSKPSQYMPDEDLQMTIIKGHIEVNIQDNSFKAMEKDMFIVPRGTAYSLKNLNSAKALLTFVVGKFKFFGTQSH